MKAAGLDFPDELHYLVEQLARRFADRGAPLVRHRELDMLD